MNVFKLTYPPPKRASAVIFGVKTNTIMGNVQRCDLLWYDFHYFPLCHFRAHHPAMRPTMDQWDEVLSVVSRETMPPLCCRRGPPHSGGEGKELGTEEDLWQCSRLYIWGHLHEGDTSHTTYTRTVVNPILLGGNNLQRPTPVGRHMIDVISSSSGLFTWQKKYTINGSNSDRIIIIIHVQQQCGLSTCNYLYYNSPYGHCHSPHRTAHLWRLFGVFTDRVLSRSLCEMS